MPSIYDAEGLGLNVSASAQAVLGLGLSIGAAFSDSYVGVNATAVV